MSVARWIATSGVAGLLAGCGPGVATSASDGGSSSGAEEPSSAEATGESTATSTGAEIPMPQGCDPRFDSGLARGEVIWTRTFPARGVASMLGVTVSASGEVFAVGSQAEEYQAEDGWFLHLAADGTLEHEIADDLGDDVDVEFEDVALTPDGYAIVVGYEDRGPDQVDTVAFSVAPDGATVWRESVELGVDIGAGFWRRRVAVSAKGRIVLGATGLGADEAWSVGLVELSPAGERLRTLPLPRNVDADHSLRDLGFGAGEVLYAGLSARSSPSGLDVEWLGRWDEDGAFLGAWEHHEFGSRAVEISPGTDGVTVLGVHFASEDSPYTVRPEIRRYDETGAERWAHVIDVDGIGEEVLSARELVTDCQGRSVVHASHSPNGGGINSRLFTYDDDGLEVDRRIIEQDPGYGIHDLAVDPFGNVVLAISNSEQPGALVVEKRAR